VQAPVITNQVFGTRQGQMQSNALSDGLCKIIQIALGAIKLTDPLSSGSTAPPSPLRVFLVVTRVVVRGGAGGGGLGARRRQGNTGVWSNIKICWCLWCIGVSWCCASSVFSTYSW